MLLPFGIVTLHAQTKQAGMIIQRLCCHNTTERSADEVYLEIFGKRTDGTTVHQRLPADAPNEALGHWDMNDGDQPWDNPRGDSRCINWEAAPGGRIPRYVFSQPLPSGQTWEILVLVMEEDGGNPKPVWDLVKSSLAASGDPYALAGSALMEILDKAGVKIGGINATNTDDFIGAFAGRIENQHGHVVSDELRVVDRVESIDPEPGFEKQSNRKIFRLNGDGSKYEVWPVLDLN